MSSIQLASTQVDLMFQESRLQILLLDKTKVQSSIVMVLAVKLQA
jgi:hypothetical protein